MTLVIVEFTVPFFAFLGMKQLFENKISKEQFLRAIKYSLYILGGICVFFLLFPGILQNFAAAQDSQLPDWFAQSLRDDRKAILRKDAFRSLIFIFLGAVVVYAFFFKKMKYQYAILLLGVFILIDMWSVDKRYLNDDQFVRETEVKTPFKKSRADQIILNDKEKNFRVLNLAVNTFNDASTSYFHNHVGGYHGAKLQRYQDLIEFHIHPEMREIINTLQKEKSLKNIDRVLKQQDILNMLNTKYIIYNPKAAPIVNKSVFGNAWFVSDYEMVENANEEIEVLNNINPKETAIIDKRFKDQLAWKEFGRDSSASIKLVEYKPNYLKYQANTSKNQIIVFSEVYYPHGWKVHVDGELQDHFRANYILRGMTIPPGEHTIEFEFKPKAYYVGNKISKISSIILLLLFFGYLGFELYRYFIKDNKKVIKE